VPSDILICLFVRVVQYFEFTNLVTKNEDSQQYVVVGVVRISVSGIYFLKLIAKTHLSI